MADAPRDPPLHAQLIATIDSAIETATATVENQQAPYAAFLVEPGGVLPPGAADAPNQ